MKCVAFPGHFVFEGPDHASQMDFLCDGCRYILVYPQGCDVCNHLSLFLCVADYDKLLPGGTMGCPCGCDLGAERWNGFYSQLIELDCFGGVCYILEVLEILCSYPGLFIQPGTCFAQKLWSNDVGLPLSDYDGLVLMQGGAILLSSRLQW